MRIDKRKLKLKTHTFEIEDDILMERDHALITEIRPQSKELIPTNDGEVDVVVKAEVIGAAQLAAGDKFVRVKDKSRKSQKLRKRIFVLQSEYPDLNEIDDSEFYQSVMNILIKNFDDVFDQVIYKHL